MSLLSMLNSIKGIKNNEYSQPNLEVNINYIKDQYKFFSGYVIIY
jgi:hypothetical protein